MRLIVLLEISKTCPEIANGFPSWAGQGEGEEEKWGGGGLKLGIKSSFSLWFIFFEERLADVCPKQ